MALTERLAIIITANGAQAMGEFQKTGKQAERSLQGMERGSQRLGAQLTRAGAAMIGFGAVTAIGMFKAAQAAEEQRAAELRLQNTLSNMPQLAGETTAAYIDQANALMEVTVADDAAIVSAQSMLGSLGATGDQIRELTPLIVDYARKYGVDLTTAAKNVGRAIAGNAGTLQRNIGQLDQSAYAADNYGTVLAALQDRVGGFAEAEGQTFTGQLEIMKNKLGEVAEGVGVGAVDAFSNLLGAVDGVTGALDSSGASSQAFVGQLLTYGSVGLIASGALSMVIGQVIKLKGTLVSAASTVSDWASKLASIGPAGGAAAVAGLAVVGVAIYGYMARQREAAETTREFTEALRAQEEGSPEAVYRHIADEIAGMIPNMNRLGISTEEVGQAITGQGQAWERLAGIRADLQSKTDLTQDEQQLLAIIGEVDALRDGYSGATTEIERTEAAQAALGITSDEATAALEAQRASIEELAAEISAYLETVFQVPATQDDLLDSFDKLYASVVENGAAFDGNSVQARANRDAMQSVITSTSDLVSAQYEQGASAAEMNATIEMTRLRLAEARDAGLISADAFNYYSGILDGVVPIVSTTVATPGLPEATSETAWYDRIVDGIPNFKSTQFVAETADAEAAVRRYLSLIDQADTARFTMQVSNNGGSSSWSGGPVPGGSGQAMPMTLHGGEYVLSEDIVDRIKRGRRSRGADASAATASGGGSTFNVTVNGVVGDESEVARRLMSELRKLERAVA